VVLANPAQGTLTFDDVTETFTFTANAGVFGNVVVNYVIDDGNALANSTVAASQTLIVGRTL